MGYFYSIPTEGSYLIVNKNLVELCALVVILVTGSGRFAGLDRILHVLSPGGRGSRRPDPRGGLRTTMVSWSPTLQVETVEWRHRLACNRRGVSPMLVP